MRMTRSDLSIGILSWGQHDTLVHTLESYKKNGLLKGVGQKFIFFQEYTDKDGEIAKRFGFDYYASPTNLGIARGYREMLDRVSKPYYLFLENDWWMPDPYVYRHDIEDGLEFLSTGEADVVRYRHRRYPGNPLWTLQFQGRELTRPEHLLDSVHWLVSPEQEFPDYIKSPREGWYKTSSRYANWTNNPHMVRTDWLRRTLAPRLGTRDIEKDLQAWWQEQDFSVMQGQGLFTHYRIG